MNFEKYLDNIKNIKYRNALSKLRVSSYRNALCKLRVSSHNLAIEVQRKYNVPPEQRLCMQCGKVKNEIHFIVECENYIENRNKLYDCAEKINAKFKHFSKDDQFLFLMKTEELSKEVAKYCYESFEKRNNLLVA